MNKNKIDWKLELDKIMFLAKIPASEMGKLHGHITALINIIVAEHEKTKI